ncbi:hypothetical protein TNIN_308811 [Trichonephila inaurata madagascariensis]|uniref:Uncharacterized protein n=1 Tax=Trichonephila inaurata madagascariensis TaxID=2747483 RepID=A0A8X6ICZ7_9ARAC|nr:hypothetical protein TNIN_308811 [Trichonephila inaurata madagascariensis]
MIDPKRYAHPPHPHPSPSRSIAPTNGGHLISYYQIARTAEATIGIHWFCYPTKTGFLPTSVTPKDFYDMGWRITIYNPVPKDSV